MIKISATNEQLEPYRTERLIRVLAKVNREEIGSYVKSIADHKGCLAVDFWQKPTDSAMVIAFLNAWYDEGEQCVEFTLCGERYIDYTSMGAFIA